MLDKIHKSWFPIMSNIHRNNLDKILDSGNISPDRDKIFKVFERNLYDRKVVFLGQDPYPTKGMATGRSFEPGLNKKPPSLRIIEEELKQELDFTKLEEQGFLFLNTALTVELGKAGSHLKYWEKFTENTVKFLSAQNPLIWILLGKKAQKIIPFIQRAVIIDSEKRIEEIGEIPGMNFIFTAPHPAAEIYSGKTAGFLDSNIFNLVDKLYKKKYGKSIKWS